MIILASAIIQVCASVSIILVAEQCHIFIIVVMVLSHIHNHTQVLLLVQYLQNDWSDGSELWQTIHTAIYLFFDIHLLSFYKDEVKCKHSQFSKQRVWLYYTYLLCNKTKTKEKKINSDIFLWSLFGKFPHFSSPEYQITCFALLVLSKSWNSRTLSSLKFSPALNFLFPTLFVDCGSALHKSCWKHTRN